MPHSALTSIFPLPVFCSLVKQMESRHHNTTRRNTAPLLPPPPPLPDAGLGLTHAAAAGMRPSHTPITPTMAFSRGASSSVSGAAGRRTRQFRCTLHVGLVLANESGSRLRSAPLSLSGCDGSCRTRTRTMVVLDGNSLRGGANEVGGGGGMPSRESFPSSLRWMGGSDLGGVPSTLCVLWCRVQQPFAPKGPSTPRDQEQRCEILLLLDLIYQRNLRIRPPPAATLIVVPLITNEYICPSNQPPHHLHCIHNYHGKMTRSMLSLP